MTKVTLEIYDDIVSALGKIQSINDSGVEVEIPEGSILFENVLNLKLIKAHADRFGITAHFLTDDATGNNLIEMIEEGTQKFSAPEQGFETSQEIPQGYFEKRKSLGKIMSGFVRKIRLPKVKLKFQFLPILIALGFILLYHLVQTQREASAKIVINSQPLTRSLTVKVKANSSTDPQNKILAGSTVTNSFSITKEEATTGTKIIGEKASGKAKVYNYTSEDRDFKKGTVLTYTKDSKDYNFITKDEITVPAAVAPVLPGDPTTPGEVEVDIDAESVGSSYNIDKDQTLSVKGQKKANFIAKNSEKTTGGKSETIKIVADTDIKKISGELDAEAVSQSTPSLTQKVSSSQALIIQSIKNTTLQESPDHKVGDEADKVSVARTVQVDGLVYSKAELDRLLDSLVKDFVPQGFVLSSKDRQVSVDPLGNSTNSTLSTAEADIQVTLKTFVVPDISVEDIKKQLAGKSVAEAEKILGSISNVKTHEFKLERGFIPIFNTVPKDINKINVEIVKE